MKRLSRLVLLAAVVAACSSMSTKPTGTLDGTSFTDPVWHYRLKLPRGWAFVKPGMMTDETRLAEFESPEKMVTANTYRVGVGSGDCLEAVREWFASKRGSIVKAEESFSVETPDGRLPGWRGQHAAREGGTSGRFSLFCDGGSAILALATASAEATKSRRTELDAFVASFDYFDRGWDKTRKAEPKDEGVIEHEIVFRGQTLADVARWYTGSVDNWRKLVRPVNPDLEKCCVPLRIGRRVVIPKALLMRSDPMPEPKPAPKPKLRVKRPAPDRPAATEDEVESSSSQPEIGASEPTPTESPARAEPQPPASFAEPGEGEEIIGPR